MNNKKHETYCNYDLTNLLTKLGFDWKDYFVAHDINEHFHWEIPLHIAQKWLREVKNIYVESVLCVNRGDYGHSYGFSISEISTDLSITKILYPLTYFDEEETKGFKKYELSLESGIKKALEIILEKGE